MSRDKSHLSESESNNVSWTSVEVSSESSTTTVGGLAPNSTYFFRVYAVNALGPGDEVSKMAATNWVQSEVDAAAREEEMRKQEESSYLK